MARLCNGKEYNMFSCVHGRATQKVTFEGGSENIYHHENVNPTLAIVVDCSLNDLMMMYHVLQTSGDLEKMSCMQQIVMQLWHVYMYDKWAKL